MKKETFHIISNTHWDREWYQCHEKYLVRLVELIDRLIDIMENNPDYRFITDGQYALIDDYINAKPENKYRIESLIKGKRLFTGPWYTQPLENIVGGEALIRNLKKGISDSEKSGSVMRFSYEIDEFGHTSQLPQILDGFGISGVMAWRGVPENCKSYFKWQGSDGTTVDFFNSNAGYGEATSLPDTENDFVEVIDGTEIEREGLVSQVKRIRDLRYGVSESSEMLWLNGIDHSFAQSDILEICKKIEKLFPEYKVVQSVPEEYARAVKSDLKEKNITPETVKGELMYTVEPVLESTNALHPKQKRRHYETEKLLVTKTEPLCAVASLLGAEYPEWAINRAWKNVLENHAHDSLGCCSVDEVYEQVMARYGATKAICEQLNVDALRYIMSCSEKDASLWIFNFSQTELKGTFRCEFDIPSGFGGKNIKLKTADGKNVKMCVISCDINGDVRYNPRLGHPTWGEVAHFKAIIDCPAVKPLGALRLCIEKTEESQCTRNRQMYYFVKPDGVIENDFIKIRINPNGTFDLTDKKNNITYKNQMIFTDDGEAGNCYVHIEPENDERRFLSLGCNAEICTLYDNENGCAVEICIDMKLPDGITADRKRRTDNFKTVKIRCVLYLNRTSENVDIDICIDNKCKNHRIRVLFPSYIEDAGFSMSGQAFDEVERLIHTDNPEREFEKEYNTHPMQDFCAVYGKNNGIGVTARGVYEYECLDDGTNALALTLLRSIEVIDNMTFEKTPEYFMHEAQNICKIEHKLSLIPFNGNKENLLNKVNGVVYPPVVIASRQSENSVMPGYVHPANILKNEFSLIDVEGEGLEVTSFKKAFESDNMILRVRNRTDNTVKGKFTVCLPSFNAKSVYVTDFEEKNRTKLCDGGIFEFVFDKKKVITFEIER